MNPNHPDLKTTCLINPRAANSRWVRNKLLRRTLERKLPGQTVDLQGNGANMVDMARKSCEDSRMIVAIGGDGTIADVLQGIFESGRAADTILGIIPFGSGNAFRKSYGIPKNPRRAVKALARGTVVRTDVMKVEGRYAGFASVGATAGVTQEKLLRPIHGLLGHLLATWKIFRMPMEEKEIELRDGLDDRGRPFDRKVLRSRFFDCIVAKTNFFGYGWRVAPLADIADGFLDLTLLEIGPARFLLAFPLLYLGIFQRTQRHYKAKQIVIRGKSLPVQYNGEVLGELDQVTFKVVPKSIRIVVKK
jgi:diacylglycerol kinase (ATP)